LRVGGVNLILPSNISHNLTNNALNLSNNNSLSTDTSGVSQASSSQSVIQQDDRPIIGKLPMKYSYSLMLLWKSANDNDNDDVSTYCSVNDIYTKKNPDDGNEFHFVQGWGYPRNNIQFGKTLHPCLTLP
jgi:hypothetical protein